MPNLTKVLRGLEIIEAAKPEFNWLAAEHDIILAPRVELSVEAEARLERLGWHKSSEFNCWAAFT